MSPSRVETVEDAGQETPAYSQGGFEPLIASIARRLLGEPLESFDSAVTEALSRLLEILDVDRSTFGVVGSDGILRFDLLVSAPGLAPILVGKPVKEIFPWIIEQLTERQMPVIVSSVSDFPPEAGIDARSCRALGVKSAAIFPIVAGDRLLGGFSFGTTQCERPWPSNLVDRLRLIGEVFAGALLRRDQEGALRKSLTEREALRERLQLENDYLRQRTFASEGFEDIVGESPVLRSVLFQIEQVAPTDATVLLLGETGTGKELIARAIHAKSARRDRTMVSVNCAALSPTLIESELFGHEKGAFTGAVSRKIGRFELATGSTVFLDEIGEIPIGLQAKLLRVLQEGEFERLGSSTTYKVDVRVIAASNRDLSAGMHDGTFRHDLYYRLGVFPIRVPPLRARREDIPVLVWHILGQLGATLSKKIERVPAPAMDRLLRYDWPGNVRELRNVLERAMILSPGPVLQLEEVIGDIGTGSAAPPTDTGNARTLEDVERDYILRALEACDWHVRGPGNAARRLGLNASTLYSRMKKLGIQRSTVTPRTDG